MWPSRALIEILPFFLGYNRLNLLHMQRRTKAFLGIKSSRNGIAAESGVETQRR